MVSEVYASALQDIQFPTVRWFFAARAWRERDTASKQEVRIEQMK
ncbi:MAG: hypothetical protein ACREH4_08390 [Vitreimonas sp.]